MIRIVNSRAVLNTTKKSVPVRTTRNLNVADKVFYVLVFRRLHYSPLGASFTNCCLLLQRLSCSPSECDTGVEPGNCSPLVLRKRFSPHARPPPTGFPCGPLKWPYLRQAQSRIFPDLHFWHLASAPHLRHTLVTYARRWFCKLGRG